MCWMWYSPWTSEGCLDANSDLHPASVGFSKPLSHHQILPTLPFIYSSARSFMSRQSPSIWHPSPQSNWASWFSQSWHLRVSSFVKCPPFGVCLMFPVITIMHPWGAISYVLSVFVLSCLFSFHGCNLSSCSWCSPWAFDWHLSAFSTVNLLISLCN
jgi:hypothetical protein